MKSFEQYIEEAYNFRLGGSQNKGYEQNKVKTFGDLTVGDSYYVWDPTRTEVHKFIIKNIEETSKAILFYYADESYCCHSISKNKLEESIIEHIERDYIATSYEAIKEKAKEKNKTLRCVLKYDYEAKTFIEESYNFRLGGSQRKGFDQKVTFADLAEGESYYIWEPNNLKVNEFVIKKIVDRDNYVRFYYDDGDYNYHSIPKKNLKESIRNYSSKYYIAASYEVIEEKAKEEGVVLKGALKYDTVVQEFVEEAYNFRLGGSQKKGFEQTKVTTFGGLTVGDSYYLLDLKRSEVHELIIQHIVENKDIIRFYYDDGDYDYHSILKKNSKESIRRYSTRYYIAASYEAVEEKAREEHISLRGVLKYKSATKEFIEEAYNFRLGGSQQKGYGQARVKTFGELEEGDEFYKWTWTTKEYAYKYAVKKVEKFDNGDTFIYFDEGKYDYILIHYNYNKTVKFVRSGAYVYATNEDDLREAVKKEYHSDIKKIVNK